MQPVIAVLRRNRKIQIVPNWCFAGQLQTSPFLILSPRRLARDLGSTDADVAEVRIAAKQHDVYEAQI